jgi:hypothetical protein
VAHAGQIPSPDSLVTEAAIAYDLARRRARARKSVTRLRRDAVIATVKEAGLLSGAEGANLQVRISKQPVKAAKARSSF